MLTQRCHLLTQLAATIQLPLRSFGAARRHKVLGAIVLKCIAAQIRRPRFVIPKGTFSQFANRLDCMNDIAKLEYMRTLSVVRLLVFRTLDLGRKCMGQGFEVVKIYLWEIAICHCSRTFSASEGRDTIDFVQG